jgi:hypothetical protein
MAQSQGLVNAHVIFIQPEGFSDEWSRSDPWQSAADIPSDTIRQDIGGIKARRFHAETTGQVLLYEAIRRLIFSGGITDLRVYSDSSAKLSAIVPLPTASITGRDQILVFGCALFNQHCTSQTQEAQ